MGYENFSAVFRKGLTIRIHSCKSTLVIDEIQAQEPLSLSLWPRQRIFPFDPEMEGAGEPESEAGQAYFLVQDRGNVHVADSERIEGNEDNDSVVIEVRWRVWLVLPSLSAGERSVRVR
jgi:hypothetical protein